MKTLDTIIAVCGMAMLPSISSAQEIRLYGGYNGSNVVKAGEEGWGGQAGYQFGADVLIGNRWFLKPGLEFMVRNLNYSMTGTAPDGTTTLPEQEFKYTSRSLRVPVMLGLHLADPANDPAVNLYLMGGPSALMNLNADLDNNALTVETNSTQWYIGFGGGLELSFLFVELGYDVAMSNVFKGDDFQTNPKVNFLHANAGIRLKLAR
jgi:hypothetical protein